MIFDVQVDADIGTAFAEFKKLEEKITQTLKLVQNPLRVQLDGSPAVNTTRELAEGFKKVSSSAVKSESEIKQAMALLIVSGQKGTDAFKQLEKELIQTAGETKKLKDALEQVDKVTGEIPKKASLFDTLSSKLAGVGKMALGMFAGNILFKAFNDLPALIDKGIDKFKALEEQKIALKGLGLSGENLNLQMKKNAGQLKELNELWAVPGGRIREVQTEVAKLGGATGKTGADITKLAIGIEKFTKGEIDASIVIRSFSKDINSEETQAGLGRLAARFPALAEKMKGITDPSQKIGIAMDFMKDKFNAMAEAALTPAGRMELMKQKMNAVASDIGFSIFQAIAPVIDSLSPIILGLAKSFSEVIKFLQPVIPYLSILAGLILGVIVAVKIWTFVQTILNATLWANPIGLIIAAIIAFVAGMVLLYTQCKVVRQVIDALWSSIKVGVMVVYNYIKTYFLTIWDTVKNIISGLAGAVSKMLSGDFAGAWDAVKGIGSNVANDIKKNIGDGIDSVKKSIKEAGDSWNAVGSETEKVGSKTEGLKDKIGGVKDGIKGTTDKQIEHQQAVEKSKQKVIDLADSYSRVKDGIDKILDSQKNEFDKSLNVLKQAKQVQGLTEIEYQKKINLTKTDEEKNYLTNLRKMDMKSAEESLIQTRNILRKSNQDSKALDKKFSLEVEVAKPKELKQQLEEITKQLTAQSIKIKTEGSTEESVKKYDTLFQKAEIIKIKIDETELAHKRVNDQLAFGTQIIEDMKDIGKIPIGVDSEELKKDFEGLDLNKLFDPDKVSLKIPVKINAEDGQVAKIEEELQKIKEKSREILTPIKDIFGDIATSISRQFDELYQRLGTGAGVITKYLSNIEKAEKKREKGIDDRRDNELKGLDEELDGYKEQLKKKQMTQAQYDKKAELIEKKKEKISDKAEKEKQKDSVNTQKIIVQALSESAKKQQDIYQKSLENIKTFEQGKGQAVTDMAMAAGTTMAAMVSTGEATAGDFIKVMANMTLDYIQKMAVVWVAEAMINNTASYPFPTNLIFGALAVAAIVGFISLIKGAIAGAEEGVIGVNDGYYKKPGRTDVYPFLLAKNESVLTAKQTLENIEYLEQMQKTGKSFREIALSDTYVTEHGTVKESPARMIQNALMLTNNNQNSEKLMIIAGSSNVNMEKKLDKINKQLAKTHELIRTNGMVKVYDNRIEYKKGIGVKELWR